jgi:hypothetical protein
MLGVELSSSASTRGRVDRSAVDGGARGRVADGRTARAADYVDHLLNGPAAGGFRAGKLAGAPVARLEHIGAALGQRE